MATTELHAAPITAPPADAASIPAGRKEFALFGEDGFTFADLIDIVNPLQHIPVIGTIYRRITGDTLDPGARLAGGALAISTLKPQMGYLLVPFLLLWALRDRRWHFVAWFAGVFGALMLAAFVAEPDWLGDWIAQIRRYPSYTAIGSPVWVVMAHYLGLGTAGEWAVNLLLFGGLLGAWHAVLWQGRRERLDWTIMLTLTVTPLAGGVMYVFLVK